MNYIDEVAEDPHFKYRGHVDEFEDRLYGKVPFGTTPFLQHKCPGRLKWIGRPLGYDNKRFTRSCLDSDRPTFPRSKKSGVIGDRQMTTDQI